METAPEPTAENISANNWVRRIAWAIIIIVMVLLIGLESGHFKQGSLQEKELTQLYEQVNPAGGYALPVSYGNLGPRLLASGVIDYDAFAAIYENSGNPMTSAEVEILTHGSEEKIVITAENAHFLLNFFWAVGLVNKNSILTEGPMMQNSDGQVDRFASTGGWTLATKSVMELYAHVDLISLTPEQQAHVEEVASAVYRPCCDNPTLFPDCNHGMAMLGLLELMASQDASADEIFGALKQMSPFWFPTQYHHLAMYFEQNGRGEWKDVDARLVMGQQYSSSGGWKQVNAWLEQSGALGSGSPGGGKASGCAP